MEYSSTVPGHLLSYRKGCANHHGHHSLLGCDDLQITGRPRQLIIVIRENRVN
ncbi:hypothetical protein ASPZODRAFT_136569 [Penicilliopsis zonata CBS 506.65]|uniref:Uncharacterized protein n=1 Tax=Penicilliopsis zonata CBS 506.65 TaxID=1073090 RepID=A0A1L9S797_9EURO|nr:hypothetical protein ASPZODRAFT_136569 [Penicilliopsis zonata CBS 506.65]OJJ43029.1 hypothetical protein ASPZODRAFT_136569 [Penicilliopsis zonata CBS 506.65]